MPQWLDEVLSRSTFFMPHGHCYLWIPSLLWMHVISDTLIGVAYLGISVLLYVLVRKIRLPFSPVFIAFGLFIGLCGLTHFMAVWTVWNPDYFVDGLIKAATAAASAATAVGLFFIRPQVEEVVHTARLSEERRAKLESAHAELEALYKKIKELDELKTEFFANVSHELRTPLSLIIGPTERLLSDPDLREGQRAQLDLIRRNSAGLLKQVNDLLDVAKLESGKLAVRYARLDLAPWLQRVASRFDGLAQQRGIHYTSERPATLVGVVDPDMMERIVLNLLSNAFKFTPDGGQVRVRLSGAGAELRIDVQDSGPGISPEHRQIVFERFRQADGGATRSYGGTGLGLAIVKELVELHQGNVEIGDSPSGGAQLTVRLPISGVGAEAAQARGAAMVDAQKASSLVDAATVEAAVAPVEHTSPTQEELPQRPWVLVVEDNSDLRQFVATTLRTEFNVRTAQDGAEGAQLAATLKPDLILTDVMMPKVSGRQLLERLRSQPEFQFTPILLLTARADAELRVEALRLGAQDYVTKPFHPEELLARVRNLIAMKRVGDALRTELTSASRDVESLANALRLKHHQLQTALDAAQVAREQAVTASQVKSQFLALVSHELRTPLAVIDMNLQMLARASEDLRAETSQRAQQRLLRATKQMSSTVETLLEYTRVESGKLQVHPERIDCGALLREIAAFHRDQAADSVRLEVADAPSGALSLHSDPRLLRVVLDNLVTNALKFTRQGFVRLRSDDRPGSLVFEIEDSGCGIPQADLSRIFEPFEQLEPVQRKSLPGVGLGLALVKEIVAALGGRIEVESAEGRGSTFRVLLPLESPATDDVRT